MKITIIAAIADNNVIGKDGKIPWHISNDLKHFRERTYGNTVVMGRKTFDSLPKALEGRWNIVLTKDRSYTAKGVYVVPSVQNCLKIAMDIGKDVFVIGGEEIYRLFLPIADEMIITQIYETIEGDTFFPEWDNFKLDYCHLAPDNESEYVYSFKFYSRVLPS